MTTFPPAPLLWQNRLALDNTHSQVAYVGYEGTIFHLSGPFAPVLGAQSGVALQQIANLDASFRHLDNKGARQDGTTWYDTLYDSGEIAMSVKLGGSTASDMRKIISSWLGAWNPTQVGKLCWYSPERGEWTANVRQAKNVVDKFEHDWYQSKEVTFTWVARNDNAFWQGVDSVCSFGNATSVLNDSFTVSNLTGLDSNWDQLNSGPGVVASPPTFIPQQFVFPTNSTYTVPAGASFVDLVGVGAGGGGEGETLIGNGNGGLAGEWGTQTLTVGTDIAVGATITVTIGNGGTGGYYFTPGNPGLPTVFTWKNLSGTTETLSAAGGLGGSLVTNLSSWGLSPGDITYEDETYVGGAVNYGLGSVGNGPGGGGPGAAAFQWGFPGAAGRAWVAVRPGLPIGTGASWVTSGTTTGTAICQFTGSGGVSQTDDQYVTLTIDGPIPAGQNAVQTVAVNATGGFWSLSYAGVQTTTIAYGASAATVQLALELLAPIGLNNVSVTGGPSSYVVTFLGPLGSQIIPTLGTFQNLTGGAETVTATTTTAGYSAYVDIWGRMNNTGTVGDSGVRARIGYGHLLLSIFASGTQHDVWTGACPNPVAGDTWSLQCGVNSPSQQSLEELFLGANWTPNQYQVYQNGTPLIAPTTGIESWFGTEFGYIDESSFAQVGPNFRGEGFGMSAAGTGSGQLSPPQIGSFVGGQGSGNFTLTNIGDQPAWPRYLCYGPGTFLISDGYTGNLISFGPLEAGQVALLNTMPRLQPVVDLTPNSPTQTTLTQSQALIESMINFATNSNVPPLLQAWESQFGIQPPQGPLTSLLSGRFTQPLAPMLEQEGPQPTYLYCQIQGGNSDSKVVAAVTPYRRWPE